MRHLLLTLLLAVPPGTASPQQGPSPRKTELDVLAFNADATGVRDSTSAIQAALTEAYRLGGGTVRVPAGRYRITGTLTMYENIRLIGDGADHSQLRRGTFFLHEPAAPSTDFLVVRRSPGGKAGVYVDVELQGFSVWGSRNSRDGIYLQNAHARVRDVQVLVFGGKAWRLRGMINSEFVQANGGASDYGFYFDPDGTIQTSVTFRGCYASYGNRIGLYVANAVSVVWDHSIVESTKQHGVVVDGRELTLIAPYFENIAWSAIRAGGGNGTVSRLLVLEGFYETGPNNDNTWDYLFLDKVLEANLQLSQVAPAPRLSLLRTTQNTGTVIWRGSAAMNQRGTPTAGTRANATRYQKGDIFGVTCEDGVYRLYMVTSAGTTARSQPRGYSRTSFGLEDGSAVVSAYGRGSDGAGAVFFDESKAVVLDHSEAPTSIRAGALRVASTPWDEPRTISYSRGTPPAAYRNGTTPRIGDVALNLEGASGSPFIYVYVAGHPNVWRGYRLAASGAAAPSSGTWATGDIVFSSTPRRGEPMGWACVEGGTPGTWSAMPNIP